MPKSKVENYKVNQQDKENAVYLKSFDTTASESKQNSEKKEKAPFQQIIEMHQPLAFTQQDDLPKKEVLKSRQPPNPAVLMKIQERT